MTLISVILIVPSLLSSLIIIALIAVLPGTLLAHSGGHKKYTAPVEGIWNRLAFSFFMMTISLPVTIITNRYAVSLAAIVM